MVINKHIMRSTNKKLVMQQVINKGPISRSQISRNLALNKVTVSDIYNYLVKAGFIREVGHGGSSENGGRRPVLGELNTSRYFVISVHLTSTKVMFLASRLNAQQLGGDEFDTTDMNLTSVLDETTRRLSDLIASQSKVQLAGICVAVNGTVAQNRIVTPAIPGMANFDVAKYFTDQFHVPVAVENSANLAAIYERDFYGQGLFHNLIVLQVGAQIRAGIVTNDQLYTGHNGHAGEVGQGYLVDRHDHEHLGAAVDYATQTAFMKRIQRQSQNMTLDDVVTAYKRKDAAILAASDDFAYYLARVITNLTTSFAPDAVILNGSVFTKLPQLLPVIRTHVAAMMNTEPGPILVTQAVHSATLLGATSQIIHQVLGLETLALNFGAIKS